MLGGAGFPAPLFIYDLLGEMGENEGEQEKEH